MSKTTAIPEPSPFFNPSIFTDVTADTFRRDTTRARRIGFLVYPNIEIIDLCGPLDAFVYADCWVRERKRPDEFGYDLRVIAPKPGPIKTMTGLEIIAPRDRSERIAASSSPRLTVIPTYRSLIN